MGYLSISTAAIVLLVAGCQSLASGAEVQHRDSPPAPLSARGRASAHLKKASNAISGVGTAVAAKEKNRADAVDDSDALPLSDGAAKDSSSALNLQIPPFGVCKNFTLPISGCSVEFALCHFVYHASTESKSDACAAGLCGTSGWRSGYDVFGVTEAAAKDLFAKKPSCATN